MTEFEQMFDWLPTLIGLTSAFFICTYVFTAILNKSINKIEKLFSNAMFTPKDSDSIEDISYTSMRR